MDKPLPGANAAEVEARGHMRTLKDAADPTAMGKDEADNSLATP